MIDRLKNARRELVAPGSAHPDDPAVYALPTLLVANKADDEAADIRLEIAREWLGSRFPLHLISAERGDGLPELRKALYDALGVIRIYTKQPGKPADMTNPFTMPVGATVAELAAKVHRDLEDAVKSARVGYRGPRRPDRRPRPRVTRHGRGRVAYVRCVVEHIPAIHAAKVGMLYPARVHGLRKYGMTLKLDLSALAPGRSPTLYACLLWDQTVTPEFAQTLTVGQSVEVVLVEVTDEDLVVSLPADPAWLAWNGGTVRQLARRIRETGETVLLPVLADALEEAGCTDAALLDHFRRPDPDGWRSWAVELLATQE